MYLLYCNFLHAVSLKYASTTFSVPTWWTGSKKSSQSYLHYYSTFGVVSFTSLVHKLLFFLAKRDNFFPCVALGAVHKRRRN